MFALPILRGWSARIAWVALVGAVVGLQILVVQHLQPDSFQRSWEFGLVGGAKVWMPNFSPVGFFAVFALGALGAGIQVRLARLRSLWFDLLALAGLTVAVGAMAARFPDVDGFGIANIPYAFPWFPLGVAVMLCAIPSAVLLPRLTEVAPIAFLARISFGIYVWHFLLMESVRVLWVPNFGYWGMTSVSLWAMVSAAVVVAAIVVATLSYYCLEAPVLGWARRLERRPDGPAATLSPATTG